MDQENIKKELAPSFLKNKKYIIIAILAILFIGFVYKYFISIKMTDKRVENIIEKQIGGDVRIDSKNNSYSIKTDNGDIGIGDMAKWPKDIPGDIPEITTGKITTVISTGGDGGWSISYSDFFKEDFLAYHSLLESKGWSNIGFFDSSINVVQMGKEKYQLAMVFNSQDKTFILNVSVRN
jgi:hypothetical protein